MAYPMDFRIAVASDYDLSGSSIETAETFGCSEAWVRRLMQRRRETGSLELPPRKTPRDAYKLDDADRERLAELIKAKDRFAEHWTKDLESWFKQGVDTPGLTMIKVHAQRLHYWDGYDQGEIKLENAESRLETAS